MTKYFLASLIAVVSMMGCVASTTDSEASSSDEESLGVSEQEQRYQNPCYALPADICRMTTTCIVDPASGRCMAM